MTREDSAEDVDEDREISRLLNELANDEAATTNRIAVCDAIGQALSHLGRVFWLTGCIVGPDGKSGKSPFGFGDDSAVGIATAIQMGGALAGGAVRLLKDGNLYAACALIRQIVEVEYLTSVFALDFRGYATGSSQASLTAWISAGVGSQG